MGVIAMYFFLVMFMTVRIRMVDTIVSCVGTPIMVLDITAPLEVLKTFEIQSHDTLFTVGRNS